MPKVTIVTLNYNGLSVIKNCVASIQKHCSSVDWEWFIAENGSTDGSYEYLSSLKDPRIRTLKKANKGNFSSMNNDLAKMGTGKYFCFLNNDTEANNNFLEEMLNVIENDERVGVVGPVLRYPDKEIQSSGILIDNNLAPINVSVHSISNRPINVGVHTRTREFQAVTGACFMLRKADFDWVRGFDATYDWAYEDVDLCLKIKYHMLKKIVCCHTAALTHHESFSSAKPNLQENFNFFKARWQAVIEKDVDSYNDVNFNIYKKQPFSPEFTFVICTHNLKMLNECVIASLLKQETKNFDFRIIYNLNNSSSAPQALNFGMSQSKTEFVVLSHHDIIFNQKWTSQLIPQLTKYQDFGVAGLAGVKIANREPCGVPVDPASNLYVNCYGEVTYPYNGNQTHKYGQFSEGKVEILDELTLVLKKSNGLYFDDKTLTHFHFYGPDICLQSLKKGFYNVVLNCPVYHKSDGSTSLAEGMKIYWREFRKLHAKWKNHFPKVVTTTGFWNGDKIQSFIQNEVKNDEEKTMIKENNTPLDMVIGEPKRLEIFNYLHGTQIHWEHNKTKLNTDKDFFIFDPKTVGKHNITASFVGSNGILVKKNWFITAVEEQENYIKGVQQNFHTHSFGEIINKTLKQEIICDINNFNRIDFFIGTYKRKNVGSILVTIKNEEENILRSGTKDCASMVDNDWNSFTFTEIPDARNKRFTVDIKILDSMKNFSPTVYYVQSTFPFGSLFHNDRKIAGCLTFRIFGKKI